MNNVQEDEVEYVLCRAKKKEDNYLFDSYRLGRILICD